MVHDKDQISCCQVLEMWAGRLQRQGGIVGGGDGLLLYFDCGHSYVNLGTCYIEFIEPQV